MASGFPTFTEAELAKVELLRRMIEKHPKLHDPLTGSYMPAGGPSGAAEGVRGLAVGIGRAADDGYLLSVRSSLKGRAADDVQELVRDIGPDRTRFGQGNKPPRLLAAGSPAGTTPVLEIGAAVANHRYKSFGSVGYFAKDNRQNGPVCLVSAAHVLKYCPRRVPAGGRRYAELAAGGVPPNGPHYTLLHPARRRIGQLFDSAPVDPAMLNWIDAAVTRLNPDGLPPLKQLNRLPVRNGIPATLQAVTRVTGLGNVTADKDRWLLNYKPGASPTPLVHKCGASSGWTSGHITAVETDVHIPDDGDNLHFKGVLEITGEPAAFVTPGDSGAAVLDDRGRVLGLVFASWLVRDEFAGGVDFIPVAYAIPIERLQVYFNYLSV